MSTITKYTYGADLLSLPLSEPVEHGDWQAIYLACRATPGDGELTLRRLEEEWNGHPRLSLVVTGPPTEGHPFSIVEDWEGLQGWYDLPYGGAVRVEGGTPVQVSNRATRDHTGASEAEIRAGLDVHGFEKYRIPFASWSQGANELEATAPLQREEGASSSRTAGEEVRLEGYGDVRHLIAAKLLDTEGQIIAAFMEPLRRADRQHWSDDVEEAFRAACRMYTLAAYGRTDGSGQPWRLEYNPGRDQAETEILRTYTCADCARDEEKGGVFIGPYQSAKEHTKRVHSKFLDPTFTAGLWDSEEDWRTAVMERLREHTK